MIASLRRPAKIAVTVIAAFLTFSACATGSSSRPEAGPLKNVPSSFQKEANRHSEFQRKVTFKGMSYERLHGDELRQVIVGKGVDSAALCCTFGETFRTDGVYGQFGDQSWESWGRYFVFNDLIVIQEDQGSFKRYAFYRSEEGKFLLAWEGHERKVRLKEVIIK